MSREVVYGSLSLILVAGLVIFLTYVPALVGRGPRWSVPAGLAAGLAIGFTLAAYYLCREERSWLAPALVVAVARRHGRLGTHRPGLDPEGPARRRRAADGRPGARRQPAVGLRPATRRSTAPRSSPTSSKARSPRPTPSGSGSTSARPGASSSSPAPSAARSTPSAPRPPSCAGTLEWQPRPEMWGRRLPARRHLRRLHGRPVHLGAAAVRRHLGPAHGLRRRGLRVLRPDRRRHRGRLRRRVRVHAARHRVHASARTGRPPAPAHLGGRLRLRSWPASTSPTRTGC